MPYFQSMKKILITGGSGFIGGNAYEYLKNLGKYEVYAPNSSELDCIDENAVREYLKKNHFDIVLHFAVYGDGIDRKKDGSKILEYNLRMFHNFFQCSDLYGRMIYTGSGAEYDKRFPICSVREDDIGRTVPVDQYGLMKYTVGKIIENSNNIYNCRVFGIFGRNEYWPVKFISNVCCKALYDLPLTIRQNVYFDYMWIDDFLKTIEVFMEMKQPEYHTYNIVSGERIDLVSICDYVKKAAKKDLRTIICKDGLANEYTANNDRIKSEIPDFSITSIEKTIQSLYKWYQSKQDSIDIYKLIY